MTKKIQVVMLALAAMFVFSAFIAQAASAEETLLAEWLVGGNPIVAPAEEVSLTEGSLKLEDTKTIAGSSAVKCTAILDGVVKANGLDEVKEILTLGGAAISAARPLLGTGAGSECVTVAGCAEGSTTSPIEVTPLGLPWQTELLLMENGQFLDIITATTIGYSILCLIFGINAEDKCTATEETALIENSPATGDASTPTKSAVTPNAICTQSGGAATGVNETTEESKMKLESGLLLTVSSV